MTFPLTVKNAVNIAALLSPSSLNIFMSYVIRFYRILVAVGPLIEITDLSFSLVNIYPYSSILSFEYNYRFKFANYLYNYYETLNNYELLFMLNYLKSE